MGLSKAQQAWLTTASSDEIEAFIRNSEPYAQSIINTKTHKTGFAATLRGIRINDTWYDKADDALDAAAAYKAELDAKDLPTLDEVALGLSDHNEKVFEDLEQANVQFTIIMHLGSMLISDSYPDALEEFIGELMSGGKHAKRNNGHLFQAFPGLVPHLRKYNKEMGNGGGMGRRYVEFEGVKEWIHENKKYGFVIRANRPSRDTEGIRTSYSWGSQTWKWFYGETFDQVVKAATEWGSHEWEVDTKKIEANYEKWKAEQEAAKTTSEN